MKSTKSKIVIIVIVLIILFIISFYGSYINQKNIILHDKKNELQNICHKVNSENLPEDLKKVYILKDVLSKEDCDYIIKESEDYALEHGWKQDRHEHYPTTDNDIKNIKNLSYLIENMVYRKIIPYYSHYYNIPSHLLGIDETFIVKYSIGGQNYLEPHVDGDDFGFVITLNKDFVGGGTYFLNTENKVTSDIGDAVIFCGKNRHMGLEITEGTRYILAGFLSLKHHTFCDNVKKSMEENKDTTNKENFTNYLH